MERAMYKFEFFASVEYKGKLFFSALGHNGLYMMDMETENIQLITVFNNEHETKFLHREAYLYGNKAWLVPQKAKYIACFNLDTFEMKYFDYSFNGVCEDDTFSSFIAGRKMDNKLFLIPRNVSDLYIIDMESETVNKVADIIDADAEMTIDAFVQNNELYIFFFNQKYYRRYNILNSEIVDVSLDFYVSSVICEGEYWYILSESFDKFMILDSETKKVIREIQLENDCEFFGLRAYGNTILMLPRKSDCEAMYDMENSIIRCENDANIVSSIHRSIFIESYDYDVMYYMLQKGILKYGSDINKLETLNVEIPLYKLKEFASNVIDCSDRRLYYRGLLSDRIISGNISVQLYLDYVLLDGDGDFEEKMFYENV